MHKSKHRSLDEAIEKIKLNFTKNGKEAILNKLLQAGDVYQNQ